MINCNNIRKRIIALDSQGLTDEEIAVKIGIDDCVGNYFDFPKCCCEEYCEDCWLDKIEEILDNEHLKNMEG